MADTIQQIAGVMQADLEYLRAIGNNLANVNTDGYKREIVTQRSLYVPRESFFDLTQDMLAQVPEIRLSSQRQYLQGAMKATTNQMNAAIDGDGFFVVNNGDGEFYTRRGDFMVDSAGRLALVSGERVEGAQGDILIGQNAFTIDTRGEIVVDGTTADRLKVVQVQNPMQLDYLGGGLIRAKDGAEFAPAENYSVLQGYMEASNVEPTHEMLKLIELVRHFETSSRVAQAYDQMIEHSISSLGQF